MLTDFNPKSSKEDTTFQIWDEMGEYYKCNIVGEGESEDVDWI